METPEDVKHTDFVATASGERLDAFLARESGESRSRVQRLIEEGSVQVQGVPKKANYRVQAGECVTMRIAPPEALDVRLEDIPLQIVYQDQDICVIDKAQGMVVHPAPGNYSGTLVNALLFAVQDLSGIGGVMRPGIVHRIDKMTSGLLVVAKNDLAHASLSAQIKAHTVHRAYLAIVLGNIREEEGVIDAPIARHPVDRKRMTVLPNGREAVTFWRVLSRMGGYTLIEARLTTGRTHQIRVHMAYKKHPVAGDVVYGQDKPQLGLMGQALHAYQLALTHPRTGESLRFYAPPPPYFMKALQRAGWDGKVVWEESV